MSKVSVERMSKIVRLIRRRGAASMALLKQELEVSEASIKRDLEFLRDRARCPLEWSRAKRGYVILDEQAEGGRFELPGVWFDSSEILALLTMLHLVEGLQPGLLEEHIGPMKDLLRDLLAEGTQLPQSIARKLRLIHFAARKVEPKHFQSVASALFEGRRLELRYWNRDRKEFSDRIISPQTLVHYRENWILDAWCHLRQGLRSFALESMERVRILDEPVIEVAQSELDAHFRAGYGIFAGPVKHRAHLRFSAERAQWVAKEVWHHDQISSYEPDGAYILEIPYSNDQELVMDLLRHSPEVEVLAPDELRQKLHTALHEAAEKNRPTGS